MIDTNRSYCRRLAEITFPQLDLLPVAIALSKVPVAEIDVDTPLPPPHRTLRDELTDLFAQQTGRGKAPAKHSAHAQQKATVALSDEKHLADALEARPDIQSRLAVITEYTPSKWLLERELEAAGHWKRGPATTTPPDAYTVARERAASGVCFSGGGIRSATFNLGILQALARQGGIGKIDYLSSVSGGGYIHQFLANWIWRAGSTRNVETLLDPVPNEPGPFTHPERFTVQPEPLRWLRRYSNYLAPRKGLFSLDTWTIAATWSRNTGLNLIVLLSSLFFVLLLPHIGTIPMASLARYETVREILRIGIAALFVVIIGFLCHWLANLTPPGKPPIYIKWACASLLGAAGLVSPSLYQGIIPGGSIDSATAREVFRPVSEAVHLHYKGSFEQKTTNSEHVEVTVDSREPKPVSRLSRNWSARPVPLWHDPLAVDPARIAVFLFATLCAGLLLAVLSASELSFPVVTPLFLLGLIAAYGLLEGVRLLFFVACFAVPLHLIPSLAVALLPPLLLGLPFVLMETGLGLVGHSADSGQREWIARLRAFSFLLAASWMGMTSVSLLGRHVFDLLTRYAVTSYTVWSGWLLTTVAGVFSARSSRTDNGPSSPSEQSPVTSFFLELLTAAAPIVFIVGLLILVATFVSWCMVVPHGDAAQRLHRYLLLLGVSLLLALVFGWRVDVNDFSMHAFYRDRLARCYGGGIDPNRVQNLFTGFTRNDRRLRVHQLLPKGYRALDENGRPVIEAKTKKPVEGYYDGPFPIISTAINLTFGEDLAYQERKAASFAFTPLFSGYNVGWTAANEQHTQFNGFVDTRSYVYRKEGGITLATACAISGAAASPSMGYHSNPAVAFLLTVFNVRLGWWLRNPRRRRMFAAKPNNLPSSPRVGILELLNELFGHSDDTTSYVYLTDGGHFDNMGLYELIRRRCRNIVVCDGESDAGLNFEGIGMAIRKARLDFGVEITLDQTDPVVPEPASPAARSARHVFGAAGRRVSALHRASVSLDPGAPSERAKGQHAATPLVVSARPSVTTPGTVHIELTPGDASKAAAGLSSFAEFPGNTVHCVHGSIRYPEDASDADFGNILYIKASLTGDEPPDVLNYRREHAAFPHDTTLNQFFTESQFESYRRLGEHIPLIDETVKSWLATYLRRGKSAPPTP